LTLRFVPVLDYPQHRRAFPRACKRGPVGSSQLGKVRHFQFTPIHNSRSYLWKLGQERVRSGAAEKTTPVSFIELRAEPAVARPAQPFEVELRSGRRVRVAAGFDAAELARLVVVLEEARP
jgi:hypothetical protein